MTELDRAISAYEERAARAPNFLARDYWRDAAKELRAIRAIWEAGTDTPETRDEVKKHEAAAQRFANKAMTHEETGFERIFSETGRVIGTRTARTKEETRFNRGRPPSPNADAMAARFCEIVEHAAQHPELSLHGAAAVIADKHGDGLLKNTNARNSWARRHGVQISAFVEMCRNDRAEWERKKSALMG